MGTPNYVLKSKAGQFVTLRRFSKKLKLCTVEHQGDEQTAPSVQIHTKGVNQSAYIFKRESGFYSPKVDGNALKVEKIDPTKLISDPDKLKHFFEKWNIESSEHYGLRSVAEPTKYLRITSSNVFCIGDDSDFVAVTATSVSQQ